MKEAEARIRDVAEDAQDEISDQMEEATILNIKMVMLPNVTSLIEKMEAAEKDGMVPHSTVSYATAIKKILEVVSDHGTDLPPALLAILTGISTAAINTPAIFRASTGLINKTSELLIESEILSRMMDGCGSIKEQRAMLAISARIGIKQAAEILFPEALKDVDKLVDKASTDNARKAIKEFMDGIRKKDSVSDDHPSSAKNINDNVSINGKGGDIVKEFNV